MKTKTVQKAFLVDDETLKAIQFLSEEGFNVSHLVREFIKIKAERVKTFNNFESKQEPVTDLI